MKRLLLALCFLVLSPGFAFAQATCTAKPISVSQTTSTDVHTFVNTGYICAIALISSTAQNIGIDEGTGTLCKTAGTALIGVSSTAAGTPTMAVAANGGLAMASGVPFMVLARPGDHLCVLQDGSGVVSGTISYADLPPGP